MYVYCISFRNVTIICKLLQMVDNCDHLSFDVTSYALNWFHLK